jgi:hypothetical protein
MSETEKIIKKLEEQGFESPLPKTRRLNLAEKDERGIPRSTGKHYLIFLRDEFRKDIKVFTGKTKSIDVQGIRYYFKEGDDEVYYDVPLYPKTFYQGKAKDKKYNYLLDAFKKLKEGDRCTVEYVKTPTSGFIKVKKVDVDDVKQDIPGDDEDLGLQEYEEELPVVSIDEETNNLEIPDSSNSSEFPNSLDGSELELSDEPPF